MSEPSRHVNGGGMELAPNRYIPKAKPTRVLPVDFNHWNRLRERVRKLGNPVEDYVNWASLCFGISIPSAISFLVYLGQSDNRPAWALPAYGLAAVFAAAAGMAILRFRSDQNAMRRENAADIVAEMDTLEEAYREQEQKAAA